MVLGGFGLFISGLPNASVLAQKQKTPLTSFVSGAFYCGGGGIRTPERFNTLLVFKTSAFSQALPPLLRSAFTSLEMTAASRPAQKLQLS